MDTQTTRVCDQCHKEVAEDNFALHESHCKRFLMVCPDCNDTVPRGQLKQHRQEQHTQVKCILCKQKVERCRLADHESDECEQRLVCCEFCQLAVPWRALQDHSVPCGSRTERCEDCGRYVTLKDRLDHAQRCPDIYSGSNARNAHKDTADRDAAAYGAAVDDTADEDTTAYHAGDKDTAAYRAGDEDTAAYHAGDEDTAAYHAGDKDTADYEQISVNCLKCQQAFPAEEIDEHELECDATSGGEEEEEEDEEEEGAAVPWLIESLRGASFSDQSTEERVVKGVSFSDQSTEEEVVYGASYSDEPREEEVVYGASYSDEPREEEEAFMGDPDQISACPHCDLVLPLVTLRWHEAKCQIHVNLK